MPAPRLIVLRYRATDAHAVHLAVAGLANYGSPWRVVQLGDMIEYQGSDERIMGMVKQLTARWLIEHTIDDQR